MTATTASIALADLIATMAKIQKLQENPHTFTDADGKLVDKLEDRRSSLEAQLMNEVRDKLGVDYGTLWFAVTPS